MKHLGLVFRITLVCGLFAFARFPFYAYLYPYLNGTGRFWETILAGFIDGALYYGIFAGVFAVLDKTFGKGS